MTEPKEDIQAQIDQLEKDWLQNHKVKFFGFGGSTVPTAMRRSKIFLVLAIIGSSVVMYIKYEYYPPLLGHGEGVDATLSNIMYVLWGLAGAAVMLISGFSNITKNEYGSKRAELQAKLDALD